MNEMDSEDCGAFSFIPAFKNTRSGEVYRSRFADGRPAPVHVLDGLPVSALARRKRSPRVADWIAAGFVRGGAFYTREQAATSMRTAASS